MYFLAVGGYPVSFVPQVTSVAGAAAGERPDMTAMGTVGSSGVRIIGSRGQIKVADPWTPDPGRDALVRITQVDTDPLVLSAPGVDQYAAEADAVARDRVRLESPELTWAESEDIAQDLEDWRDAVHELIRDDRE